VHFSWGTGGMGYKRSMQSNGWEHLLCNSSTSFSRFFFISYLLGLSAQTNRKVTKKDLHHITLSIVKRSLFQCIPCIRGSSLFYGASLSQPPFAFLVVYEFRWPIRHKRVYYLSRLHTIFRPLLFHSLQIPGNNPMI
jgi:hypothetical protein